MSHHRVFSLTALLLAVVLLAGVLSACGAGKVESSEQSYDASKYMLCTDIPGTEFLAPRAFENDLEDSGNFSLYSANDLKKHKFEWYPDEHCFGLFQPGNYGCYAFEIGNIDHAEGERNVEMLPAMLGISSYLSFTMRDDEAFSTKADPETGYIRNVFPVAIHDKLHNLHWYGYLTLLKNPDTGANFAMANGYANAAKANQARFFSDSFQMVSE